AIRLLAPSSLRSGELDQARPQQHADVEVKMARVDAEPLGELPVRELPVALLAEHFQDAYAERMAERLQLLRLVEYQRLLHCRAGLLHIDTPLSSRKLGCSSAIQDYNGSSVVGSHEARGRLLARLARERTRGGLGLFLAGEQEDDLARGAERGQAQRHAVDERLE